MLSLKDSIEKMINLCNNTNIKIKKHIINEGDEGNEVMFEFSNIENEMYTDFDKYCYISTRILPPFFDHKYRIAYSKVETVNDFKKILHPVVREAIRKFSPNLSLEIHHDGDLPARTGIGSSSAFTVGLINSLLILQDKLVSSRELANEAIELEQIDLMEKI